jgi:hypothetical protein
MRSAKAQFELALSRVIEGSVMSKLYEVSDYYIPVLTWAIWGGFPVLKKSVLYLLCRSVI